MPLLLVMMTHDRDSELFFQRVRNNSKVAGASYMKKTLTDDDDDADELARFRPGRVAS
jgi:hypothetical protein